MVMTLREDALSTDRLRPEALEPAAMHRRHAVARPRRKTAKARKFSLRRAGYGLLIGICALAAIGVPVNALFFQDARHPAPIFLTNALTSTAVGTVPAKTSASNSSEAPGTPVDTPKTRAEGGRSPVKSENARNDFVPPAAKNHPRPAIKPSDHTKRDPIAELLNEPAKPQSPAQSDVLMAQQALLKLGYVVRADGKFTKATQKAIEKFEHDNGMQVKGVLTTKIAAMLASRAGLESE